MDFGVLADFNPWWQRNAVPGALLGSQERPFLGELKQNTGNRFIMLLHGMRRVGKTTAFYQLIQHLLDTGTESRNILYFSFDEKDAAISDVISAFEEKVVKKRLADNGRTFIFFDEIQKAEGWEAKIKVLYDLNPDTKVFLSGSAAVSLRKKSAESLAGRMLDIEARPLSFREFLGWKKVKPGENELDQREMMPMLADYLRKGGFPEMAFEDKDEAIKNYIKNSVLEKIIYRDIPSEFGAKDAELLRALLEIFTKEPGMIINTQRLSKDLGRSKITVSNYIEYLKQTLLIMEVRNLRPNMLLSSRKGKKIYPSSTAFCFAMQPEFYSDRNMEKIYETAVAAHISAECYYRNSFEVDFVKKNADGSLTPIEVKHGAPEAKQLSEFMRKFGAKKGVLVTKEAMWKKGGATAVTLWLFLLQENDDGRALSAGSMFGRFPRTSGRTGQQIKDEMKAGWQEPAGRDKRI